jgi:DNA-binding IscR family transcriptional regulator
MTITELLAKLKSSPESIEFNEVMDCIDANYSFTETAFTNGKQQNAAGENNGSCKLLYFAQLHDLTKNETLALFGKYYREDVLENHDGDDHQNIRQFMQSGFEALQFDGTPLSK